MSVNPTCTAVLHCHIELSEPLARYQCGREQSNTALCIQFLTKAEFAGVHLSTQNQHLKGQAVLMRVRCQHNQI